jgi:peptide/nickel transport system ATP-binding protein/oligopeptide transport system ATP-binding protein
MAQGSTAIMPPLLDVHDLHVHFPTGAGVARAVDGVSFRIAERQTVCLVGESGCGKTATMLALFRLHPPSARLRGVVRFEDTSVLHLSESDMRRLRGRGMALVFQEPASSLNPICTIGSQLAEVVRLHRALSRRGAWTTTLDLLGDVQLSDAERVARQYPHELSGGMQQRVVIALALAGRPRLLVADEPTTALDTTVQAEILALLRRLRAEHGMALLLITHDLGIVAEMAETVAVMYAGKIVEQGPVADVFRAPLHPYTAGLLSCRPRPGAAGRLRSIEGVVPPATVWPEGCRFGPRCPQRTEQCIREPPLEEHRPGHVSACWHWEQVTTPQLHIEN